MKTRAKSRQHFRIKSATFDFSQGANNEIQFVSGDAKHTFESHITMLMGANGTCKSRILSSLVNLVRQAEAQVNSKRQGIIHKRPHPSENDLECLAASILKNGTQVIFNNSKVYTSDELPSRVLVLANLVRDRFVFEDWEQADDPFYYYLGVRQASNLTTTGAMSRIASNSILKIADNFDKINTFQEWAAKLFPSCETAIVFRDFSLARISKFLSSPEDWISRQPGSSRSPKSPDQALMRLKKAGGLDAMVENMHLFDANLSGPSRKVLKLADLSTATKKGFGESVLFASSIRLIGHPSLMVKTNQWLEFSQLSSGEQNMLSTGARLIGFSEPGSLIIIDEPEVSLNVIWQQRYIELIQDALKFAQGSHVIIASHSPYLVSDLHADNASIIVAIRKQLELSFKCHAAEFWGWGSEAILYDVLGISSASNFHFSRDLAAVLKLIQNRSTDPGPFKKFLKACESLDFSADDEPLRVVIDEIRQYYETNIV